MGKLTSETAFVRAGLLLLCLIVLVGVLYLTRRRDVDMDVAGTGKAVAGDLERAAEAVRDTSEDAFLTAKVKTALALSRSTSAMAVDIDSNDGTVTLTGAVPSNEIREAVLEIARDTEGVMAVVDRLQVDARAVPETNREALAKRLTELEIESAVYERLLQAEGIDAKWIRIRVDGRVVFVAGSVQDSAQKERVSALVASVAGVESVVNELEVSHRAAGMAAAISAPR